MDFPVSSDTILDGLDTMRPPWADYPLFSKDASDSDSDFGSIVTHVSHAYEDEEMMILLKEQPAEMLERLRSLSAERVHRGTNEELLRVTNAFARLAERFMLIEPEDSSLPASRGYKRMWGEVVRLGLPEYLVGAVREDTLFDENPIWIHYILILVDGTRSHINLGSDPDAIAQYLRLFGGLCQNAYINREVFIEANHLIDRYAPDHSQKLRLRMNKILSLSLGKPLDLLKGRRLADLEDYKCLHKLLLHNWYYRAHDDGWEVHTQVTFAFATLESPNAESTTQDYHNFADEIILAIGARRFLESLSRLVRDEEIPPLILGRNLLFVKYIVPWRPFHEHYGPSGFFEAVSEAVDRYAGMGASLKNEWQVFEPVLLLLTEIIRMAPVGEGVGPLVKRFDFIDLVACTTICYAQLRTEDDTNTTCVDAMQELTLHAASATMLSDKNTFKTLFRKNMKAEWYSTLKTLRDMNERGQAASRRRCARLVVAWRELGLVIGLDEEQEKEVYEKEMRVAAQKCAWGECEYHLRRPTRPTRACVGCGDARYCSRPCQRRHWQHGHKEHCGNRLKSEPHKTAAE